MFNFCSENSLKIESRVMGGDPFDFIVSLSPNPWDLRLETLDFGLTIYFQEIEYIESNLNPFNKNRVLFDILERFW